MSEFYGYLQGNHGEITRGGSKKSGIRAQLQSWRNVVIASLERDPDDLDGPDIVQIIVRKKNSGETLSFWS